MNYLAVYLLFINIVAIIVCAIDKLYAKKGWRRVPEIRLFIVSLLGGALGMYIAMLIIRHKTKHKRFMIGLPIIIFVQALLLLWLLHIAA